MPPQFPPVSIAIHGAAGRMGRRLVALCQEDPQLRLVAALEFQNHPLLNQDAGLIAGAAPAGVPLTAQLPPHLPIHALIDFSTPAAMRDLFPICIQRRIPMVIGTTGLVNEDHTLLSQLARDIPILQAANMSLGVNLLLGIVARIAQTLGDDYDIEITESHHRFKKDAPSGTALALAQAICTATGKNLAETLVHGRQGEDCLRRRGSIGMHALRQGDIVGQHTVTYAALGENLAVSHTATNRDVFVRGALHAAKWLALQPPGRYTMKDVLGL